MDFLLKAQSLIELPIRVIGPIFSKEYINLEQVEEYNFTKARISRRKGVSCMLRAKDEEKIIIDCLKSIDGIFDEIIFIDNGSKDKTKTLVDEYAKSRPEIFVYSYDITVSKCGIEHQSTEEESIHSLAYYYNWCASKCNYSYICKWDADMILCRDSKEKFKKSLLTLSSYWPTYIEIEVQTAYKKLNTYYLAKNETNREIRVFPNRSDVTFKKGKHFEILNAKIYKTGYILSSKASVLEIKDVEKNEFSHWGDTDSFPTERKKLEWENFKKIKNRNIDKSIFEEISL